MTAFPQHRDLILDQFTRQAAPLSASPYRGRSRASAHRRVERRGPFAGLPTGPDALGPWIKLDLLTRRVLGRLDGPRKRTEMKSALVTLALVGIMLGLATSSSLLAQGPPSAFGLGSTSCERYLDAVGRNQALGYVDWLQGFLTAAEWLKGSRVGDPSSAIVWLNEYCRQNSRATFGTAAMALTNHLAERAKTR